jgi:uroporphyrinogen-III synthase
VRAAGLAETWSPDSEASDEVLARLLTVGVAGRRVAVQLHGEPLPGFVATLRAAGAEVVEVPVYRWVPAEDLRPLRRLVAQSSRGQVDCVTFTSAPAVASLLRVAAEQDRQWELLDAMRGPVLAACVGR